MVSHENKRRSMLTLGHQPQTGHMYISESTLACTVSQSTLSAYLMCDACTHVLCHKAHYLSTLCAYNMCAHYMCTICVPYVFTVSVYLICRRVYLICVPYLGQVRALGFGLLVLDNLNQARGTSSDARERRPEPICTHVSHVP